MTLNRSKLYSFLFIACLVGYIWLYFSITRSNAGNIAAEVCLIKNISNIPCPSCGSTRSVVSLSHGDFIGALNLNPIGYLLAFILLVAPIWIIADAIMKSNSLFYCYKKTETYLRKPKFAIPLIFLLLFNWIWNITKGL